MWSCTEKVGIACSTFLMCNSGKRVGSDGWSADHVSARLSRLGGQLGRRSNSLAPRGYRVIAIHRAFDSPADSVLVGHDWGAWTCNAVAALTRQTCMVSITMEACRRTKAHSDPRPCMAVGTSPPSMAYILNGDTRARSASSISGHSRSTSSNRP